MKFCSDKLCDQKGQLLPLSDFTSNRQNPDGLSYICRRCSRRNNRKQYHAAQQRKYQDRDIKVRKPRSVDQEKTLAQVFAAIQNGYNTREQIELETRLNEDVISDAIAELWDTKRIQIHAGHYYPIRKAA